VEVIRLPAGMRRRLLATGTASAVIGAGVLWAGITFGNAPLGVIWSIVAFAVAVYTINAAAGRVVVGPDGIRSWTPMLRHHCQWTDIADITGRNIQGRGSSAGSRVVIRRSHGRAFALAAPLGSSQDGYKLYGAQLEMIRSRWNATAWRALEEPP